MLNDYKAIGRLTKEIELKKTKNNKSYIAFTLAISKGKDKQGNPMTDFINFQAWEGRAETIAKYLKKGDIVFMEGELINNNYEYEGVKHYTYVVNVNGFTLLPNNRKGEEEQQEQESEVNEINENGQITFDTDDLPFY